MAIKIKDVANDSEENLTEINGTYHKKKLSPKNQRIDDFSLNSVLNLL